MNIYQSINHTITGTEALSLPEKISLFFKEVSLGIDSFNSKQFNGTIHKVNPNPVVDKLIKANKYFDLEANQIAVPVTFNSRNMGFPDYMENVCKVVGLIKLVQDECNNTYKNLKEVVGKGVVPMSLRTDDNFDQIEQMENWISQITDNNPSTLQLNLVWSNFDLIKSTTYLFNKRVSMLGSREPEVLSKTSDQVVGLIKLLNTKMKSGELVFDDVSLNTIEIALNRLSKRIKLVGAYLLLLNTLTRSLELQVEEMSSW